jgi:(2S)-methylsuccinyl-CoA dehydrogenase
VSRDGGERDLRPAPAEEGGCALLDRELSLVRERVARAVAADGADAHQVAIDNLVWAQAYLEAARAVRAWADHTADAAVRQIAAAAEGEAAGVIHGRSIDEAIADGERLAQIAARQLPPVDLGASHEHRLLRAAVRDFAAAEIQPIAQALHRGDLDIPESVIAGVARLGLFGVSIPEAYGGSQQAEPDAASVLIATEELSRASLGAGGSLMTRPEILVRALVSAGTEEQKRRWLPAIADGSKLVAVAVTEPDHGSDVAGLRCRATRRADGDWEITGPKLWCTFAGRAELLTVLCRTSDQGHRGLSLFVLEKPAFAGHEFEDVQPGGGILRGRAIPTIGYRGMHSFELAFDRYRVPALALVGADAGLDRGFYLQLEGFAVGRLQTAGRAIGVAQAALDAALRYAGQRRVFGRMENEHQLVLAKLGAMAVRTNAARQLSHRAARLLDEGRGQTEAALAKLHASRIAEQVTREAMQLHGAMGYGEETDVSRYFVDARVFSIFEGAEEVLSLRVIGRSLLEAGA